MNSFMYDLNQTHKEKPRLFVFDNVDLEQFRNRYEIFVFAKQISKKFVDMGANSIWADEIIDIKICHICNGCRDF
jgi:hypothetical protein